MKEVLQVRVAFADTDAMGVAWHGNYLRWFEMARTELLRAGGFPYRELVDRDIHLPAIEVLCRYRKPARYDDLLRVFCETEPVRGVRLRIAYRVLCGDLLVAEGHTEHAFTNGAGKPIRPTPDVLAQLAHLHDPPA